MTRETSRQEVYGWPQPLKAQVRSGTDPIQALQVPLAPPRSQDQAPSHPLHRKGVTMRFKMTAKLAGVGSLVAALVAVLEAATKWH